MPIMKCYEFNIKVSIRYANFRTNPGNTVKPETVVDLKNSIGREIEVLLAGIPKGMEPSIDYSRVELKNIATY